MRWPRPVPAPWEKAKTAGTKRPMTASTRSVASRPATRLLKRCMPLRRPPKRKLAPRTSSRLPMIDPVMEALTTSSWPAVRAKKAMMSSADVAERGVQDATHLGTGQRPQPFGADTHDEGQPEDARCAGHEDGRAVDVQQPLHGDGQEAHREGRHDHYATGG